MRFCHENPSVWGLSSSSECLLCKGGLWLGGGSVDTYIATASRIQGAFTAAPVKLRKHPPCLLCLDSPCSALM